jgi:ABC-type bacteriocin/lantibiotic exporter with double-glycine peptidase domain
VTLRTLAAWLLLASPVALPSGLLAAARTELDVPVVVQARARCGQAALEMVMRYYGADSAAVHEADRAYDPALGGSLITDLAAAARRAGLEATIAALTPDSLVAQLAAGVPPIVLYQNGRGPLTRAHFGVVTGWDSAGNAFTLHDGGAHARVMGRETLAKRWRTAGSQALILRRAAP